MFNQSLNATQAPFINSGCQSYVIPRTYHQPYQQGYSQQASQTQWRPQAHQQTMAHHPQLQYTNHVQLQNQIYQSTYVQLQNQLQVPSQVRYAYPMQIGAYPQQPQSFGRYDPSYQQQSSACTYQPCQSQIHLQSQQQPAYQTYPNVQPVHTNQFQTPLDQFQRDYQHSFQQNPQRQSPGPRRSLPRYATPAVVSQSAFTNDQGTYRQLISRHSLVEGCSRETAIALDVDEEVSELPETQPISARSSSPSAVKKPERSFYTEWYSEVDASGKKKLDKDGKPIRLSIESMVRRPVILDPLRKAALSSKTTPAAVKAAPEKPVRAEAAKASKEETKEKKPSLKRRSAQNESNLEQAPKKQRAGTQEELSPISMLPTPPAEIPVTLRVNNTGNDDYLFDGDIESESHETRSHADIIDTHDSTELEGKETDKSEDNHVTNLEEDYLIDDSDDNDSLFDGDLDIEGYIAPSGEEVVGTSRSSELVVAVTSKTDGSEAGQITQIGEGSLLDDDDDDDNDSLFDGEIDIESCAAPIRVTDVAVLIPQDHIATATTNPRGPQDNQFTKLEEQFTIDEALPPVMDELVIDEQSTVGNAGKVYVPKLEKRKAIRPEQHSMLKTVHKTPLLDRLKLKDKFILEQAKTRGFGIKPVVLEEPQEPRAAVVLKEIREEVEVEIEDEGEAEGDYVVSSRRSPTPSSDEDEDENFVGNLKYKQG